jgi:hypothetical protein
MFGKYGNAFGLGCFLETGTEHLWQKIIPMDVHINVDQIVSNDPKCRKYCTNTFDRGLNSGMFSLKARTRIMIAELAYAAFGNVSVSKKFLFGMNIHATLENGATVKIAGGPMNFNGGGEGEAFGNLYILADSKNDAELATARMREFMQRVNFHEYTSGIKQRNILNLFAKGR